MDLFNQITDKSILVIGDSMLDVYCLGTVTGISPEAPVPVFRKHSQHSCLGGAANVAENLLAAGQRVLLLSAAGNDENGKKLLELLEQRQIGSSLVSVLPRKTTAKTRFLTGSNQQVMRLDVEDTEAPDPETVSELLCGLERGMDTCDLIVLSDYRKGLLTPEFTRNILHQAKLRGVPVIADARDPDLAKYRGAFLVRTNQMHLQALTGMPVSHEKALLRAARSLRNRCSCEYVLVTCGAGGMALVWQTDACFLEASGRGVYDVTGVSDTVIAYLAACVANGFAVREAVEIANAAAGIQVSKAGTSCVYWSEIRSCLSDLTEETRHKILDRRGLTAFRRENGDRKIVFTNGCFDILHIGHIRCLQEAAKLGDVLVVGLNSDASVKRLKGEKRPLNREAERAELLCALEFVDYVVIFEEDTPYDLIRLLQPDVLVKGGDYTRSEVVGADLMDARGKEVVLIPFVEGRSTTNILAKIEG